jgi:hypothetical protein
MTMTTQFQPAMQAYEGIQAGLRRERDPLAAVSRAAAAFAQNASPAAITLIPDGALLLGLAEDGLPLLLDPYDPAPGPLLVAGGEGCGKTAFLQSLARLSAFQTPGDIQFGVLTPYPEEWRVQEAQPNCLGVWPAYHPAACHFLAQLISWAEQLPSTRQAVMLLVDGLDLANGSGSQLQDKLQWLLQHGPQRQVWPALTVNSTRLPTLHEWNEHFRTRILCRVMDGDEEQYVLDHPGCCVKFRLPPLGQGV